MFYNILDKKRLVILPLLKVFKKDFYLAGGTGLALQIGHRDSIDFDFFSKRDIDTQKIFLNIKKIFSDHKILKIQEESNTLTVLVDDNIKLSFFSYPYKLIYKTIDEPYLNIASITDIALMKFSVIVSRAANKDYIDLYFIIKLIPLEKLLSLVNKKLPDLDLNLVLKSLVYFEDITKEPIKFKNNRNIDFKKIKNFFENEIIKIRFKD